MLVSTPISAVMTREVWTLRPHDTMQLAQEIFRARGIHHLPVVDQEKRVVGMISKSDYLMLLHGFTLFNTKDSLEFNEKTLSTMLVEEVMAAPVAVIKPGDTLETAAAMFRENRFHALPVVENPG
ncbi:MAG: CBS domain-containing protein, partial [Lewinella sp.]|nr:CBS domain-containing protein [Lewinella sp.]